MRKRLFLIVFELFASLSLWAQVPQRFTYQAVVRDANGRLVASANVGVRLSILQGAENGPMVYSQSETLHTNANGLFSTVIGDTTIEHIDWGSGVFFLRSEVDPDGGNNYSLTTVQQIFSVPYAIRAHTVDSIIGGVNYTETDPVFSAWNKDYNDLINRPTIPTNVSQLTNDAGYLTSFTETQILTISNDTIFLTGGSFVKLPAGLGGTIPDSISAFVNDVGYITGYTESQVLSISNDTVFLTGGSFVKLPAGFSGDYNDLSNKPTIPTVPTNVSAFTNDAGYLTSFTETQVLTISNDTIYLTGGSFVKLPASFSGTIPDSISAFVNDIGYITDYTETQVLSISNDTIFLTGGSFVKLPAGFSGNYNDLTNKPTLFSGDYNDLVNQPTIPTVPTNVSAFTNDAGYLTSFTESQILSISNDTIYLTGGSFVKLPAGFSGDYNDLTNKPTLFSGDYNDLTNQPTIPTIPTNVSVFTNDAGYLTSFAETQVLTISNDTIYLTGGSFVKLPASLSGTIPDSISAFVNDVGYITGYTESQVISISNDTLYLTGGSFVKLPASFSGDYNDLTNKPILFSGDYNDLTNKPTLFSGDYNDLTNQPTIPTVPTNVSAFTNDAGYLTSFTETQILTISNDTIYLTGGSFVKLPASLSGTIPDSISAFVNDVGYITSCAETQVLSISNDTIYLTGGSFVKLPASLSGTIPDSISAFVNDVGYITGYTESQIISISNDTIYLTGGSFVKLPAGFSGDYNDLTNKPTLFSGDYNDLTNQPTIPTVPTNVSAFTNDAGYLTSFSETQILTISNDTIYLTGGSFVKLPAGFSGDYNDLSNRPTLFSGDYNDLTNQPTIPTVPTNVSAFNNDAGYLTSFTETQILTISNDTIYLTGGGFVKLPAGFSGDYNDLTNKPTLFSGDYNDLSNKPIIPTVPTNVSSFANDAGYLTSFTETQILSISNDTIYLTGGSYVKLPAGFSGDYNDLTNKPTLFSGDYNDLSNKPTIPTVPTNVSAFTNDAGYLTSFTESQILSISHDTVFLTGGSFVKLPAGFSGDYNDLINKPTLFSGDYNDLTSKPTLFSGDYNDLSNKPTIPTVPTNVSEFTNDAGYITTYTETQTLADVASLGNSVNAQIKNLSNPTDAQDAVNLQSMTDALQTLIHRYDSIIAYQQRVIDTLSRVTNITGEAFDSIGASYAVFSVSPTKKVRFSKGNLQYIDTGYHAVATGGTASGTWRFADNQFDTIGVQGDKRDRFLWATSGWNHGYTNPYLPTANSASSIYNPTQLNGAYAKSDWGVYNAISNGGNLPNMWRTLSQEEWNYLLNTRSVSFARYCICKIEGVCGILIFPDDYTHPSLLIPWPNIHTPIAMSPTDNTHPGQYLLQMAYTNSHLEILEKAGCIFLPFFDYSPNTPNYYYWTSDLAYKISLNQIGSPRIQASIVIGSSTNKLYRIRLVRDVED